MDKSQDVIRFERLHSDPNTIVPIPVGRLMLGPPGKPTAVRLAFYPDGLHILLDTNSPYVHHLDLQPTEDPE